MLGLLLNKLDTSGALKKLLQAETNFFYYYMFLIFINGFVNLRFFIKFFYSYQLN